MNAPGAAANQGFDDTLLQKARNLARLSGRSLLGELEALTAGEPRQLVDVLARRFRLQVIDTTGMLACGAAFDLLPLVKAQQRGCLLLRAVADDDAAECPIIAVIADPFDSDCMVWLSSLVGTAVHYRLALAADIQAYLSKHEESVHAVQSLVHDSAGVTENHRGAEVLSFASLSEASSPAVKLVNSTVYDAVRAAASDVHLESTPTGITIKYRLDGVLDTVAQISGVLLAEQVVSRLKVLAELDIGERRTPQDGSFRVQVAGRDIDLRVSIMPSIHGEDAVVRILDKRGVIEAHGSLTLDLLGFDAHSLKALRRLVEEPYGMLLVTGPTGSGKTTTLYGAISEINSGRDKIITIEDPVEYQLPGVLQIPVNDKKGLTFARGLRSILRHDPDKIMVGEIRDRETAEIAVQSALTGHLVLTTVHANNVFDVFGRFTHMGIDPYAFASALNGIWAQRLLRVNCARCSESYTPGDAALERYLIAADALAGFDFRRGGGCGDCRGTGYRGRKAIAEVLNLNDELRELIIEKRPIRQLKEVAYRNGTRSLTEAALRLVASGETTLEELHRVTLSG
ncbi:MAG: Type II traffic warden ATPase [Candidatus Accumulibacter regalis]|jgi:general secretion pathway protein E|uniref:Type II traffic warden ATPase n=1 Tax=Accumulibacter regalis TaxID=522306 RepID=A0A011P606_ACCRE|nr:GspE/PulE family protein [Accumulibacter sp.]EXI90403.1 MAG: Type II traffic warden ATPase [Candidatus Accumulibacter regalis]MBN8515581.1 type II/IV secretion system protein [Accumulibacter sp.]MBO3702637.1 type II/IV secretion system protein [Accumulibacter sp.]HRE70780.1 GspE/PulE family protein [Accumulibacter sp.]HRE84813.1 GspE/PulE family protein [Accumulibacter sp.]